MSKLERRRERKRCLFIGECEDEFRMAWWEP
jgi:hypothetical protein